MAHDAFVREAGKFGTPERLAELVERERAHLTLEEFFNKPVHQPLKDAWQAAVFALGYQSVAGVPVEVRLSSQDQFPDFQLRVEGVTFNFECVMAVTKPLGKVYRGDKRTGPVTMAAPATLPPFDCGPLEQVVAKKAGKRYDGKVHLLVYVNFGGAAADEAVVLAAVRSAAGAAFESVWLVGYGRDPQSSDGARNFIACAKPSPVLVQPTGWVPVPLIR